MSVNGTGLTFPKRDEWSKIKPEEWFADERSAFLRFKLLTASMFLASTSLSAMTPTAATGV